MIDFDEVIEKTTEKIDEKVTTIEAEKEITTIKEEIIEAKEVRELGNEEKEPKNESFYPWESPECQDKLKNCQDLKKFCPLMPIVAYRQCRKTCKMCFKNKPKPRILKANLNSLSVNASLTLTQTNPDAPAFMTVCALLSDDIQTYSAIIHSFGEVIEHGKVCESFGPHYNPYGVNIFEFKKNCFLFWARSNLFTLAKVRRATFKTKTETSCF